MAAFRVAAGRFGGVAAVACGGLADAVGAVVGAHGLAKPALAGTERLFRESARAVSLFAGRWGEDRGLVRGIEHPVAAGGVALLFAKAFPMRRRWHNGLRLLIAPVLAALINALRIALLAWINASGLPHRQWWFEFLHDSWGGLVLAGVAMQLLVWLYVNDRVLQMKLLSLSATSDVSGSHQLAIKQRTAFPPKPKNL
jgi:exosortase/archaeosortase family protein